MEYQNKVRCCLELVKKHVQQSSTGYQQLADRLKVSLLTVKRQLNGDEISMSKLLALCDAAQVSFGEIWEKVELRKVEHNIFTKEQDFAFYHFPHLFRYFAELCFNKQSPAQIEESWSITAVSTHLYLRKLETLGLLKLSEKGNPTLLLSEPMGFSDGSLNVIKAIQVGLKDVSDKLIAPREDEPFVITKPMLLSSELRHNMYKELSDIVSRYAELSERYYIHSNEQLFQLVICDYKIQEEESPPEIINITAFE